MNTTARKKPVLLLVTGTFLSHSVWEGWKGYFEKKGYRIIVPPWPGREGTAMVLRQQYENDHCAARLSLEQLIEYYAAIARGLNEKPVVIGHSLGGLIAQVLLNRDMARAAAALHSFPVHRSLSLQLALSGPFRKFLIGGSNSGGTYLMSQETFNAVVGNGMSAEQQRLAYEKYIIPESRQLGRDALVGRIMLDFKKKQGPLLLTAGLLDRLIPARLCRRTYKKYKKNGTTVRFATFFTSHSVLTHVGWKAEADYVERWVSELSEQESG